MALTFWNRISQLYDHLPEVDRLFLEYAWNGMGRIASQFRFEVQNAFSTMSPAYLPIYHSQYWQHFAEPWDVDADMYSIPTLQDRLFTDIRTLTVDTHYTIQSNTIMWTPFGPLDGDMGAVDASAWSAVGSPTSLSKSGGALVIEGDAGDGAASTAFTVDADTYVRVQVQADAGCTVQLVIDGAIIEEVTDSESGADLTLYHEFTETTAAATIRIVLLTGGTLSVTDVAAAVYPRGGRAFAPQAFKYNPYLDQKFGYLFGFTGINSGQYTPRHGNFIMRALNTTYRSGNTEFALLSGLTAVLGLPFAYSAGTVTKKVTEASEHLVTITDAEGNDTVVPVDTGVASLSDLVAVGTDVEEFAPLIPDALKLKTHQVRPAHSASSMGYPGGTWSPITAATVTPAGNQTDVTAGVNDGVTTADQAVTAGATYRTTGNLWVDAGCLVEMRIVDVTNGATITREWFGDSSPEAIDLQWDAPATCNTIRIDIVALTGGTFHLADVDVARVYPFRAYRTAIVEQAAAADLVLSDRGSGVNLTFTASQEWIGTQGHNIHIALSASSADQPLSSTLTGTGAAADPYIYTIITGTQADQSSNNAIVDFVNNDPKVLLIVHASTAADDAAADPAYTLAATALTGGVDMGLGVYDSIPLTAGDPVTIRNTTSGFREEKTLSSLEAGTGNYVNIVRLAMPLVGTYQGTDILVLEKGKRSRGYVTGQTLYNRWNATYTEENVEAFLQRMRSMGYDYTFMDVSP